MTEYFENNCTDILLIFNSSFTLENNTLLDDNKLANFVMINKQNQT